MTLAPETDISGVAPSGGPRTEQPKPSAGPSPKAGAAPKPPAQPKDKAPAKQDAGSGAPPPDQAPVEQPPPAKPDLNPFAPIKWAEQEAETAYHTAARVAVGLKAIAKLGPQNGISVQDLANLGAPLAGTEVPTQAINKTQAAWDAVVGNALTQSVQNVWNQNTAQAAVARFILAGGLLNPGAANLATSSASQRAQYGKASAGATAGVLGAAANPLNAMGLGEEGIAARLAMVAGPQLMQGLASQDPKSALTWAALTGSLLSISHLGELKEPLMALLGKNGGVLLDAAQKVTNAGEDLKPVLIRGPKIGEPYKPNEDYIQQELQKGGFQGFEERLATAAEAGGDKVITGLMSPEGKIRFGDAQYKQVQSVFKALGVTGKESLIAKAATTGFNEEQWKLVQQNWGPIGFDHDLIQVTKADAPLRNPRVAMARLPASSIASATEHMVNTNHLIAQTYRGVFGTQSTHGNTVATAIWRSLLGLQAGTEVPHQAWISSTVKLLGEAGIKIGSKAMSDVGRAVEDPSLYEGLSDHAKVVVDSYRLVTNAARRAAKDTEHAKAFVGDWLPRVQKNVVRGVGAVGKAGLVEERQAHRATTMAVREIEGEPQLFVTQKYMTVDETNKAVAADRTALINQWMDPARKIPNPSSTVTEIRNLIHKGEVDAAQKMATAAAHAQLPEWETDFVRAVNRGLGRQISAIHSSTALRAWEQVPVPTSIPKGAVGAGEEFHKAAAVVTNGLSTEERQLLTTLGYRGLNQRGFTSHLFSPQLASLLDRAFREGPKGLQKAALDLEGEAVGLIVYTPQIHMWNMIASAMSESYLMTQHPLMFLQQLRNAGKIMLPHKASEQFYAMTTEALNGGMIVPPATKNFFRNFQGQLYNVLGDTPNAELDIESETPATMKEKLRNSVPGMKAISDTHAWLNQHFCGWIQDLGTFAFHLEKQAKMLDGMDEQTATLWAGRRANSVMGMLSPVDTNPVLHNMGRLAFLAPSYWRTRAEMMIPIYKRSGIPMTANMMKQMAYTGAATTMTMVAIQKASGEAVNHLLSGHFQNENLPGNQDKIEITNPYLIQLLKDVHYPPAMTIDPKKGEDPATGGRLTLENPIGRVASDLERMGGFQSGHPGWQASDIPGGIMKTLAARAAPFAEGAFGAANIDLYRSIADGQEARVDPTSVAPTAASLLLAAMYMTPAGINMPYVIDQAMRSGQNQTTTLPGGVKIPKAVTDAMGGVPGTLAQMALNYATGVTPPYVNVAKTRGQTPTDSAYQSLDTAHNTYYSQMSALDQEVWSGKFPPSYWLTNYLQNSKTYGAVVNNTFGGAPGDAYGADGMLSTWEGLYGQATQADGSLDYYKLDQLQAKFEAKYSQGDLELMQQELTKNDSKFKMLGVYHSVVDQYGQFQKQWAATQKPPVDINTLRQDISTYGSLYNDTAGTAKFLATHHDVAQYEAYKKGHWENTPAGALWELFYSGKAGITYLNAHHETSAQLEQEVSQETDPGPGIAPSAAPTP